MKYIIGVLSAITFFALAFSVCSPAGKNKTGHEYMPDMAHPVSIEANVYSAYSHNHWDNESVFTKAELAKPRTKVPGTIARGATGVYYTDASSLDITRGKNASNAIAAPINGEAPFYFANTEEERLRCENEMVANPFPITTAGLEKAKPLYNTNCGICHGDDGGGQGWLVAMPDSKYPAQPKNLIGEDMIAAGNGRYYFAMIYGKNVMGGYSDKLSFEERWQVLHYIRSLQAKKLKVDYNEKSNTLSNIGKPAMGEATGPARVKAAQ